MTLNSKIQYISGVGPKMAAKLNKLGVETIRDLLLYFPRRYNDYTTITPIASIGNSNIESQISKQTLNSKFKIQNSDCYTISGTIIGIANRKTRRRGFTVTEAVVADDSGSLKVVWFNQPYLAKMLRAGSNVILNGKVGFDAYSNGLVMESPVRANRPKIVPVYGETAGISSFYIAKLVAKVIYLIDEILEHLPHQYVISSGRSPVERSSEKNEILRQAQDDAGRQISPTPPVAGGRNDSLSRLLPIQDAILSIHQPRNAEELEKAQRRLAFDELFFISLRANLTNLELKKEKALLVKADITKLKKMIVKLPFELTSDQKKALWAIMKDMEKDVPMSRLLNGDVGSGKTIVAALAAWTALEAGKKTLVMCPTTILANQHYETFCKIFSGAGVRVGIKTSSREEVSLNYESGIMNHGSDKNHNTKYKIHDSNIIIGTQALIQKGVRFNNVALVVADEQHRFGVAQRAALHNLHDGESKPHFLSMTATPIPRTLHLALFGDLDISVIREKPADRKEIKTRFVQQADREKAYEFIRDQIKSGRQCFVICPLIEDTNDSVVISSEVERSHEISPTVSRGRNDNLSLFESERKSVKAEFEKLKKIFPEFKIEMLHGKMSSKRGSASGGKGKDEIMAGFSKGETQILVSTSVVEVGVDVPNAAVMIIEDAERFGLAQIHQFRGRVGRAEHQSYCFLFSNTQSEKALQRLKSLEAVSDGFKLAEIDLETRGPGVIFGTEQSGLLDLKMASFSDRILIEEASAAAKVIAPEIKSYPKLLEKLSEFTASKHME